MSDDEIELVRDHSRMMLRRLREHQTEGGGSLAVPQAPEGSPFMNVKQLVSLAALVTASTVGVAAAAPQTSNDIQATTSQEQATETNADEDTGKNAF